MSEESQALKKRALERFFSRLNPRQREAVFRINGPVLILAGAGSGKTTVLVNRIANMIFFGNAYHTDFDYTPDEREFLTSYVKGETNDTKRLSEILRVNPVNPWNILAITFTNKAANELKERISAMLGAENSGVTAATFHSACVRILRREADKLPYNSSFAIYDTDDQKRVIKSVMRELDISERMFNPRSVQNEISHSKESLITPERYLAENGDDYRKREIGRIYSGYQQRLLAANAMDFDDILCVTVELFEKNPDVLNHYQNLYKYIVVDEYQDTNNVQYKLVSMLSSKHENLCVVGDDDQSIYKFRGATIENILNFENQFDSCKVIRLEQNYRSTQNILDCANTLIKNNRGRKGKTLFTNSGSGEKVVHYLARDEKSEAKFVADTVLDGSAEGESLSSYAVLYRMNAQSNAIEQAFINAGIAYKIFSGTRFYDREEIKDVLAYLAVINNPSDIVRFRRIINKPKRSIGEATVRTIEQIASDLGESPIDVMRESAELIPLSKKARVLVPLAEMFDELRQLSDELPLAELLDEVMQKSGYCDMRSSEGEDGIARLENIEELKSTMANYEEGSESPSLSGFLEEIALYTETDGLDENGDYVAMMTMHSAKGLEFDTVFAVGMEENVFPSQKSILDDADIEEERRLCYVAITRARKKLYLTSASKRLMYGRTTSNPPSRFLNELDGEALECVRETPPKPVNYGYSQGISAIDASFGFKKPQKPEINTESFAAGDRVSHKAYGDGTVLSVKPMGKDNLLEVAFDEKGTKKIMANFSRIKKL